MKAHEVETQADYIEYFEELLDYLGDRVPCLDDLIATFNKEEE